MTVIRFRGLYHRNEVLPVHDLHMYLSLLVGITLGVAYLSADSRVFGCLLTLERK